MKKSELRRIIKEEIRRLNEYSDDWYESFAYYVGSKVVGKAYDFLKPFKGWEDTIGGGEDGIQYINWVIPGEEDWWDNTIGVGIDSVDEYKKIAEFGMSPTVNGDYKNGITKKVKLTGKLDKDAKLFVAWIKQQFPKMAKKYFNK